MPESPTRNRRDDLLDAAMRLFTSDGFRGTGIDRLLAEAGVAKMTLYNHFKSKDELIAAALERASLANVAFLESNLRGAGADRLLSFFDVLGAWCASDGFNGCVLLNAAAEFKDREHPVRLEVERHALRLRGLLERLATEAGAADPAALAAELMLLTQGAIEGAVISGCTTSAAIARRAADVLINAAR